MEHSMRAGRTDRFRHLLALAMAATIALALAAACGGETPADRQRAAERAMVERSQASAVAVAATAVATAEPAATPMAGTPATSGDSTSEASATDASDAESDMDGSAEVTSQQELIALGEQIYFEGGTGGPACQVCHGKDAMGLIGPAIIGKGVGDIELQLEINPAMQGLYPTQAQMEALAAYLQSLAPPVQAQ